MFVFFLSFFLSKWETLVLSCGRLAERRAECVSVTFVYRKVGHPSRWNDRVTGCSRKQGLLSVSLNTDAETQMPQELKANHYPTLENHLLCLRCECVGLRTWDLIKTSKNIARIMLSCDILVNRTQRALSAPLRYCSAFCLCCFWRRSEKAELFSCTCLCLIKF